jgi:bla regulator protein blaR1
MARCLFKRLSSIKKKLRHPDTSEEIVFNKPTSGKIVTPFGYWIHPNSLKKTLHDGIDIANKEGTDVFAAAVGKVVKAEHDPDKGFMIVMDHNESWRTEYRYFAELSVKKGEAVKSGDLIGHMGSTGQSTGPHLHFSILKDGSFINPAPVMK